MFGWTFWYSSAQRTIIGYSAHAPETRIVPAAACGAAPGAFGASFAGWQPNAAARAIANTTNTNVRIDSLISTLLVCRAKTANLTD
jgi:hypothetical protein